MNENEIVKKIYHLRENFALIGLTGRTGSGCTTIAKLFNSTEFDNLHAPKPSVKDEGISNDERKYKIIYDFAKKNWNSFTIITASDIIFYFVLLLSFENFIKSISEAESIKTNENDKSLKEIHNKLDLKQSKFEKLSKLVVEIDDFLLKRKSYFLRYDKKNKKCKKILDKIEKYKTLIFTEIPKFRDEISEAYGKKMFHIYQAWGNNIRRYGTALKHGVSQNTIAALARKINAIIKMLEDENIYYEKRTFIIIDAIRNPYEVLYFKERYGAFYLLSVTTDDETRKRNLYGQDYKDTEIQILDSEEYPKKQKLIDESYTEQDIQKCIELSDIYVYNNGTNTDDNIELKKQLIKFFSLIMHPGLITPTPMERVMQIAYVAKMNSGCLSRQVGAAITNSDFSVKAIGWNTVPQGQTPCDLCNFKDLVNKHDKNAYSDYELQDIEFRNYLEKVNEKYKKSLADLKGLPHAFCFKDLFIGLIDEKNQVHTRSLHAEENAFLQLAKYGSIGIKGGKLFTTASPCELCGKKAYQLGIPEIYYIDIYPGITEKHVLNNGTERPKLIPFQGAIGRAYDNLYNPLIMLKDEIIALTGVNPKNLEQSSDKKSDKEG